MCILKNVLLIQITLFSYAQDISTFLNQESFLIAFGQFAQPNQFPYQVSVRVRGKHHCGGSIIGQSRIISAAHCFTNKFGKNLGVKNYQVLAGTIYVDEPNANNGNYDFVLSSVTLIVVHRKYKVITNDYDVAVIVTEKQFDFSLPNFAIIPMSNVRQEPSGTACVVSGWGKTESGSFPETLKYSSVQIVENRECKYEMVPIIISPRMICAFGEHREESEVGDSGGPLVCHGQLVGVVSFGKRKTRVGYAPEVYTRVTEIEIWARTTNASERQCTISTVLLCLILVVTSEINSKHFIRNILHHILN